jgi:hypothetical protein
MELTTIGSLLTVASVPQPASMQAWTRAALQACTLAEEEEAPLWQTLSTTLETSGWVVEASSQQTLALPLLAGALRADPGLAGLLDRRGGIALPDEATALLDAWWTASLTTSGPTDVVMLAGTLQTDAQRRPTAQLYAVTLPSPSWRWLVRTQLVPTRLHRLSLRLDERRYELLARILDERTRPHLDRVRRVQVQTSARDGAPSGLH